MANYTKKDDWNFYAYRGVMIFENKQVKKPIMYYGRRNQNRYECLYTFGDDFVSLREESQTNYNGTSSLDGMYAEFLFDKNNHITNIKYRVYDGT